MGVYMFLPQLTIEQIVKFLPRAVNAASGAAPAPPAAPAPAA